MSFKKYLPISIFIALQACVLQIVDQLLQANVFTAFGGFGWIAFQAWAMYFLAGGNIKGAARSAIGYFLGIIASILIFTVGGAFSGLGFFAMPVGILVCVTIIMLLEITPEWTNFTAALFVGAGAYFGLCSYVTSNYLEAGIIEMLYCMIGLLCGFITVTFRGWYEPKFVKTEACNK